MIKTWRLRNLLRFTQVLCGELGLEPICVCFQSQDYFSYSLFIWSKLEPYHQYLVQAPLSRLLAKAF